ncbi:MAG: energy-coupling factor ABC transporter ATP-binding protein [Acidobacteriota bacterium]
MKVVEIKGLSYSYPDGTQALDEISLVISQGEKVAILGPNGAGKSSLLLHLNGILRSNGHVTIFGMGTKRKNLKSIRQKVGLVFQDPDDQLFCPTVFDDVAFGPRNLQLAEEEVASRVFRSLTAVGVQGLEQKSAVHLSVGQKKRVAIATVLSMDSEVLVLDEPTSNLDPRGRKELLCLLTKLGGTQIIATHDLEFAGHLCDRIVVLCRGRKVAEGPAGLILSDHALLESQGLK